MNGLRRLIVWGSFLAVFLFGTSVALGAETLSIGVGPYYNADKMTRGFAPVIKHLAEKLDRTITFTVTESYEELADKVEKGELDVGFFGAVLYLKLKQKYPGLRYLVTAQSTKGGKKRAYYYSWLIAHKNSGMTKVKHLRGKSFGFANKHSSSGYVFPMAYFNKRGIVPEDFFSTIVFAGSHEKVTDGIAKEEIEAGVTFDANLWSAEEKHGRVFRRIKKIGPILNPNFAAHHLVDAAICEKIIFELENLPATVFNNDLVWTGFQRLQETDFEAVREVVETTK